MCVCVYVCVCVCVCVVARRFHCCQRLFDKQVNNNRIFIAAILMGVGAHFLCVGSDVNTAIMLRDRTSSHLR